MRLKMSTNGLDKTKTWTKKTFSQIIGFLSLLFIGGQLCEQKNQLSL